MKKSLFFLFLSALLSTSVFAQGDGISIQLDGAGPDISGGTHFVNLYGTSPELSGGILEVHFVVTNTTGADKQWKITRKKINVPSSWIDQICWPPLCYNASGDVYMTPNSGGNPAPTIVNGTNQTSDALLAELKPRITPDLNNAAYSIYRYYITDVVTNAYVDSVDLNVNFTLGVTNAPKPQVPAISLSPNPANDHVTISLGNDNNGTIRVTDALGKVVMTENIYNGQKHLNVSDLKSGVYIVIVESPGMKSLTKKLIVRH
jgi:hypothetical protein